MTTDKLARAAERCKNAYLAGNQAVFLECAFGSWPSKPLPSHTLLGELPLAHAGLRMFGAERFAKEALSAKARLEDCFCPDTGDNLLAAASRQGKSLLAVQILLDMGISPQAQNSQGQNALHICCAKPDAYKSDIAQALMPYMGSGLNARDASGDTPLSLALATQGHALVPKLLQAGADPNIPASGEYYPICLAARFHPHHLSLLAERGANPNQPGPCGNRPLHFLCLGAAPEWALRSLLDAGADPDAPNSQGQTPLHLCAEACLAELASSLLRAGADPDFPDCKGQTPRQLAGACPPGHPLRLLLPQSAGPADWSSPSTAKMLAERIGLADFAAENAVLQAQQGLQNVFGRSLTMPEIRFLLASQNTRQSAMDAFERLLCPESEVPWHWRAEPADPAACARALCCATELARLRAQSMPAKRPCR